MNIGEMFKKGPDIDKRKLLIKALDVKEDSVNRLKHFKTLIELDHNEVASMFKTHFNSIYRTFFEALATFPTFDATSSARLDELECIFFILEHMLIHNTELIKKQWQLCSITSVMQKLLHQTSAPQIRQEGVRLFIIWFKIFCDENNAELLAAFGTIVPNDLLQVFVLNSSDAFMTRVHDQVMLDEQVQMCKRIMNIYRFMVMKIYMNTPTWEQLLTVMLSITEQVFPIVPPSQKELTIAGRIAPAFFQTFIVSWIRANLYVHITDHMWNEFHRVMRNLVRWKELIEEWGNTMGSLTRVLVKHVYDLNLSDLPLNRVAERRRRSNMNIEHDHSIDSQSKASSTEQNKSSTRADSRSASDKCVLLGGKIRGWTHENSVIMWRRMLGLFGNINQIEDPENHLVAIKSVAAIVCDFLRARENLGVSIDNQSTPALPSLVPPYIYPAAWLLEATHLPRQYKESRLAAYKLLCLITVRRHDIELSSQYYVSFYEAIQRGLTSPDPSLHTSIIDNAAQLLSFELPGSTLLVQILYERSCSILLAAQKDQITLSNLSSRDSAVQILSAILALNKPIKKVVKPELSDSINQVVQGDIKSRVFDALLACNVQSVTVDFQTRMRSLCALALHVYQELFDKSESLDVEKLFDTLLTDLHECKNDNLFRVISDLLRLFSDHARLLTNTKPVLVSSIIQVLSQVTVRLSVDDSKLEQIQCLLICLEDWCLAVDKAHLLRPVGHLSSECDDEALSGLNDSLITIVLGSLESVMHDEQFVDGASDRCTRGSISTSKNSIDTHSSGQTSQGKVIAEAEDNPKDWTLTNESQQTKSVTPGTESVASNRKPAKNTNAIKLACRVSYIKLITYIGHFPLKQLGAASMSCFVNESDYIISEQDGSDFTNNSLVHLLVVDNSTIVSFIGARLNSNNIFQPVHVIIRNLCGKYSWDASCIETQQSQVGQNEEKSTIFLDSDSFQETPRNSMKYDSDFNDDGNSSSSLSSRSSNRDCISDLLNQLSLNLIRTQASLSSSSSQNTQRKRNSAQSVTNPRFKVAQAEETMIALLTNQRFQELNHCEKTDDIDRIEFHLGSPKLTGCIQVGRSHDSNSIKDISALENRMLSFDQSRQIIQQLGYLSWDKRCKIDSLVKSSRLVRELKNLDSQCSRETHKIAVLYVADGQEDKNSILSNLRGSNEFEEFVAGLGWDVNLGSHLGFKGGLQSNKSTSETSPYYSNGTTEVMFHVSTRISVSGTTDDEALNRKLRHLGNDEIHIVWSEHVRDYRRGIIPTEFGDVIIAIYPMLTFDGYYRIQIASKDDVPPFGPLFDNCIVHQSSLAQLVRATAINASRAKRLQLPYYKSHYEERSRLIETIVQNHKEKLSFEEFAAQLYSNNDIRAAHELGAYESNEHRAI